MGPSGGQGLRQKVQSAGLTQCSIRGNERETISENCNLQELELARWFSE